MLKLQKKGYKIEMKYKYIITYNKVCVIIRMNCLIIDVETTGLVDTRFLEFGDYPHYTNLYKYQNARIVQFSFMLCNNKFETIGMYNYIIKKNGFDIPNSNIHNITNEISLTQGVPLTNICETLNTCLENTSHIIAHNVEFDVNVLLSELHRLNMGSLIKNIESKLRFCSMNYMTPIMKLRKIWGKHKSPRLDELYFYVFKKTMENAHNSNYDVINLHKIIQVLFKDNNQVEEEQKQKMIDNEKQLDNEKKQKRIDEEKQRNLIEYKNNLKKLDVYREKYSKGMELITNLKTKVMNNKNNINYELRYKQIIELENQYTIFRKKMREFQVKSHI